MGKVAIGLTFPNLRRDPEPEEILSFIQSRATDIDIYERTPPPPGAIRAAAFEYQLVFEAATAAGTLALVLLEAYKMFIAPKKTDSNKPAILVIINKDNGTTDQFWIDDDQHRETFIEDFTHKVESISTTNVDGESTQHMIEEIHTKSRWTRRK